MRVGNRDYRVKSGLTIFLAISVVSALAILFLAADPDTWTNLTRIRPKYAALAFALMAAQWSFNAIRFKILVNSLDNSVSFSTSLRAFMTNVFAAAITPSQTGGGAMQIYVLNRAGVPVVRGFAGCLMGAMLSVFCLVTSTLAILFLKPGFRIELGQNLASVLIAASVACLIFAGLFVLSIFKIDLVKRWIGRGLLVLTLALKADKRLALTKRVLTGLDQYRECLSVFVKTKKHRLLLALVFTLAGIATNALIGLVLLAGLNVEYDVTNVYLAQFVLFFIAYFGPTPGASGIAEFSNFWVLSSLDIQPTMLGIYTVMWRFYTSFIGVAVGGLIVLTLITRRKRRSHISGS